MVFLEVKIQRSILIPPDQLVWVVIFRLMSISTTRKSSNKYGFFVDVTSGDKIGEGRIRDLTGDVLFPVTCKGTIPTTIPTVTMINLGHCWCVMSNKTLTDISSCADPPHPWTGALTPRVPANQKRAGLNILS